MAALARAGGARRRRRRLGALVLVLGLALVAWYVIHQTMPAWYARLWYPLEYTQTIRTESARHNLDPAFVAAVIYRESKFVPDSRSSRGAVGLMQLLPPTAEFISAQPNRPSAPPDRLTDPDVNIAYGTWYLRYLIDRYGTQPLALAAYNGGESNLQKWMGRARAEGRPFRVPEDIAFPETRHFVRDVGATEGIYRRAYGAELGD
ncbi:MAG: soluble lytic murein transglycosylase [Miltoncostaeaceae bacterium]|nr:soluble lytic murein transglycosylase [Miltoncostaeaceae bacterium]